MFSTKYSNFVLRRDSVWVSAFLCAGFLLWFWVLHFHRCHVTLDRSSGHTHGIGFCWWYFHHRSIVQYVSSLVGFTCFCSLSPSGDLRSSQKWCVIRTSPPRQLSFCSQAVLSFHIFSNYFTEIYSTSSNCKDYLIYHESSFPFSLFYRPQQVFVVVRSGCQQFHLTFHHRRWLSHRSVKAGNDSSKNSIEWPWIRKRPHVLATYSGGHTTCIHFGQKTLLFFIL